MCSMSRSISLPPEQALNSSFKSFTVLRESLVRNVFSMRAHSAVDFFSPGFAEASSDPSLMTTVQNAFHFSACA